MTSKISRSAECSILFRTETHHDIDKRLTPNGGADPFFHDMCARLGASATTERRHAPIMRVSGFSHGTARRAQWRVVRFRCIVRRSPSNDRQKQGQYHVLVVVFYLSLKRYFSSLYGVWN